MGRTTRFRERLLYQVRSVRQKTPGSQLAVQMREELALSVSESELLATRLVRFLQAQPDLLSPEQIRVEAVAGRAAFGRRHSGPKKTIRLTPFAGEDLDVEEEFGLEALQTARLMRLIKEADAQDALLRSAQLSALLNLTPTALRGRLQAHRESGLWLPVVGLSKASRAAGGLRRSTWLLMAAAQRRPLSAFRRQVGCSRSRWTEIKQRYASAMARLEQDEPLPDDPEVTEWVHHRSQLPDVRDMMSGSPRPELVGADLDAWSMLRQELTDDFGFPPVKVRAVRELLEEISEPLRRSRPAGAAVFWAVADDEPAGKPLAACRLIPVELPLVVEDEDVTESQRQRERKRQKILRYATAAKRQGALLTYADLSFLLGIHTEAIRRLIDAEPRLIAPLRGRERDIGRGVTHRREIIQLHMQMHTETEIVARSGHSYTSVENYINEFARILLLRDRGMPAPMIRRVTGRSMRLVRTYLDLIEEYDQPEYAFRFEQLRRLADRSEAKKGAPTMPLSGGGA